MNNLLPLGHIYDSSLRLRFLLMLHAGHGVLIGSAIDGQDVGVVILQRLQEFLLCLIHLALDAIVALCPAEATVLALRGMVAEAQPPVLSLVGHHVLRFQCQVSDEVERDVFQFFDGHTSVLLIHYFVLTHSATDSL